MSQQARNDPEQQPSYLASYRFLPYADDADRFDLDDDDERRELSERDRWLDSVDSDTNREYL